jgi:REP element-mobilizing transposase RayT
MKIISGQTYHIYNQGNNQETIFYCNEDYLEFLKIFRKTVYPHCKVLAYCLMPNHFHFLIDATEESARIKRIGNIDSCELSNGFRLLQSSYAQYINKKYERTGSLFRQKAKAKSTSDGSGQHRLTAFHYIHQNPLKAGLVTKLEDWPFSSFADYAGLRNGTLCNKLLAQQLLGFGSGNFIKESYESININIEEKIFDKRDLEKAVGTEGQTAVQSGTHRR